MRYLLILAQAEIPATEQEVAMSPEYAVLVNDMVERGVLVGGERLRPHTDATTVRVRDGQVLTTDGPFAETKEAIGGYFLIDVKDLDEAIEIAARIPGAQDGSVEIRPIWEMSA